MNRKNMVVSLPVLISMVFASCARDNPSQPKAPADRNWVILAEAPLDAGLEVWRPTESDVPRIIQDIRPYLEKERKTTDSDSMKEEIGKILAQWDQYACQVVGITRDGKKLVHFNFFPKDEFGDWRRHYIEVNDGGADFWRIEYDCKTTSFLNFVSNGYA
jgi:hypothetical protein